MSVIDDYLDHVDAPQKAELERIRKIVNEVVPDAEEVISYGMPGFKYKHKYLIAFAAFKNHMSVFPAAGPIEALKEKLSNSETSRGTVQFTLQNPIPESIIKELVLLRLEEIKN